MAVIKTVRTRQPAGPARIDWSNPVTRGLVDGINGRTRAYIERPQLLVPTANATSWGLKPTNGGVAYTSFGGNAPTLPPGKSIGNSSSYTLLVLALASNSTVDGGVLPATGGHLANSLHHYITDTDGVTPNLIRGHAYVGGSRTFGGSFTVANDSQYCAIVRHRNGVEQSLWVDGRLDPNTASFTGTTLGFNNYGAYGSNSLTRYVLLSLLWDRALTDAEIVSISRNPWQVFAPERRLWVPHVDSAGNVFNQTITGSLTAQGAYFRFINKNSGLSGSVTTSGTYNRFIDKGSKFNGSITTSAGPVVSVSASVNAAGSITPSGVFSRAVTFARFYGSTLAASGGLVRSISKIVGGSLTLAGRSLKGMFKALTGAITAAGSVSGFKFTPVEGGALARGLRFMRRFIGRR